MAALFAARWFAPQPIHSQRPVDSAAVLHWQPVALGVLVLTAISPLDATVARGVAGHPSATRDDVARQLARTGQVEVIAPVVGGLALAGVLAHNRPLERVAVRTAEGVAIATVATQLTKYAVARVRPYADGDLDAYDFGYGHATPSFPSGHTAAAFALATALGDASGRKWARIALWAVAAGTGWARVAQQAHWTTDVLAGAAVGIGSARLADGRLRIAGLPVPHLLRAPVGTAVGWTVRLPGP
jgi:membrane-associated phospholipid phosphatase